MKQTMHSLAIATPSRHRWAMPQQDDEESTPAPDDEAELEAARLGEALRSLRLRAKLSQEQAGERFGITGQGWYRYESGKAPSIFKPNIQRRLAEAVDANVTDLLAERVRLGSSRPGTVERLDLALKPWELPSLPLRRRVQAGAWLAVEDLDPYSQPLASVPIAPDPRFPFAKQWLSEVVGDSMNRAGILQGDLIHCVDIIDIGYHPRTGDLVEVERLRFQGRECEVTVKQVEVTVDQILLWPRSDNPRFKAPLALSEGLIGDDTGEEFEVQIRGLVLASIRRFRPV